MTVERHEESAVPVSELLEAAKNLLENGFNVLPVLPGKKMPGLPSWKRYQTEMVTNEELATWFGPDTTYTGLWVVTGRISRLVVLDCDSAKAETFWQKLIGDQLDATTCVQTARGRHYWFRTPSGPGLIKSWSVHKDGVHFDVLAEGKGVMAPPSPHPSGESYGWTRGYQ
jgi:hypothetical protein